MCVNLTYLNELWNLFCLSVNNDLAVSLISVTGQTKDENSNATSTCPSYSHSVVEGRTARHPTRLLRNKKIVSDPLQDSIAKLGKFQNAATTAILWAKD